jgi:hypothetical protein
MKNKNVNTSGTNLILLSNDLPGKQVLENGIGRFDNGIGCWDYAHPASQMNSHFINDTDEINSDSFFSIN